MKDAKMTNKTLHEQPNDLHSFFQVAMNRQIPAFSPGRQDLIKLNVGAGLKHISDTEILDLPEWNAEKEPMPYEDDTVGVIYALGFLDHISNVPGFLKECQRVLAPGGTLNVSVAYYNSQMAHEDLYHKSWFAEGTWRNLMQNEWWSADEFKWKLTIGMNVIMGIVERNLCLLTQFIKE
jgi:SAM-dependent methyltransferase